MNNDPYDMIQTCSIAPTEESIKRLLEIAEAINSRINELERKLKEHESELKEHSQSIYRLFNPDP